MKGFKKFIIEEKILLEGGNAPFIKRETGEVLGRAERMDMSKVSRKEVRLSLLNLFKDLNIRFGKKFDKPLWPSINTLTTGKAFNGSSEHFFDDRLSDAEFRKYKKVVGDVDLTVPKENLSKLFDLLTELENKKLANGDFIYKGQNKKKIQGHQINAVFQLQNPKINLQVDFESVSYDKDSPDSFGKFSHNSTWKDIKEGLKGLAHKHLLTNIARALSEMNDVVVLTPASPVEPPEKIKISTAATKQLPTNLAFSVDLGIRQKYEPAVNSKGQQVYVDGKQAFRELKTSQSKYSTDIPTIYTMLFKKKPSKDGKDLEKFHSFVGVLELLQQNRIPKKTIEKIFTFMLEKSFFGRGAQGSEVNNPEGDRNTKMTIVNRMVKQFPYLKPILEKSQPMIDKFYENYKEVKIDS